MSLLSRAGKIVIRTGQIVLATAQACIDLCCGKWVCSAVDATPGSAKECYQQGQEPYPSETDQVYDTELECNTFCDKTWYCCWVSMDHTEGSLCQESPCAEGYFRSGGYATEEECTTSCDVPPEWYCCWESIPYTSSTPSACQEGPCPEGYQRSGPHLSPSECADACSRPWAYYCCMDSTGELACELGYACPEGQTEMGGPYSTGTQCGENCEDETLGACCYPPVPCTPEGECETIGSYWAKTDCGECTEHFPEYSQYFSTRNNCRVYMGDCTGDVLGWATIELCANDGYVSVPCVDDTFAYQCTGTGKSWHANMSCYQINCPGDCYGQGYISACQGSPGTPTGHWGCYLLSGANCAEWPEITIEITGVASDAVCMTDSEVPEDYCQWAPIPAVRSLLASLLNASFVLPNQSTTPCEGEYAGPCLPCSDTLSVCETQAYTWAGTDGLLKATANITLAPYEGYPTSSTNPVTPECQKSVCYTVIISFNVAWCPNNDFDCEEPYAGCSYGSCVAQGSVQTVGGCGTLAGTAEKTKACDCSPVTYECEASLTGLTFEGFIQDPYCGPTCCLEDLFDGAEASITISVPA